MKSILWFIIHMPHYIPSCPLPKNYFSLIIKNKNSTQTQPSTRIYHVHIIYTITIRGISYLLDAIYNYLMANWQFLFCFYADGLLARIVLLAVVTIISSMTTLVTGKL